MPIAVEFWRKQFQDIEISIMTINQYLSSVIFPNVPEVVLDIIMVIVDDPTIITMLPIGYLQLDDDTHFITSSTIRDNVNQIIKINNPLKINSYNLEHSRCFSLFSTML